MFAGDYLIVQMRVRTRFTIIMGYVVTVTDATNIGAIGIGAGAIPGPVTVTVMRKNSAGNGKCQYHYQCQYQCH